MIRQQEPAPARKSRVFVVDDHPLIRQGLRQLIDREPDLAVCGEAEESGGALHSMDAAKPDIVIVDIALNGPDGIELLKNLRVRHPGLPVLILSMHDQSIYEDRALRAGANGYIMKQEAIDRVLVAIRRILNREIVVGDRVANKVLQQYVSGPAVSRHSSVADLTHRELEVFRLLGQGSSTRQIAEKLHLSVKTVESYQAHIKEKLSLGSARELVQHAIRWIMGDRAA